MNAIGPQGAKGDTGATGATGDTGPQGPQGEKGDPGDSYYANGVLSSFGYHIDDCDGTTEKFVYMAAQGGVNHGVCMEKNERAADQWGGTPPIPVKWRESACPTI